MKYFLHHHSIARKCQLLLLISALCPVFATDGAFFSAASVLPEIAFQRGANISQKGQGEDFLGIKSTISNTEVEERRTLSASSVAISTYFLTHKSISIPSINTY